MRHLFSERVLRLEPLHHLKVGLDEAVLGVRQDVLVRAVPVQAAQLWAQSSDGVMGAVKLVQGRVQSASARYTAAQDMHVTCQQPPCVHTVNNGWCRCLTQGQLRAKKP